MLTRPLLTRHLLEKFSRQFGRQIRGLTQRAKIRLARHDWPGNVRELENVLGHGCMMAVGEMIDIQDLPEYLRSHSQNVALPGSVEAVDDLTLETHEKRLLVEALAQANGNQSEAARSLRIGRDALRYKMKKHNLDSPGAPKAVSA